nr:putative ribonuclease H-like domain-containing protein [Tanacetum cinerariifolium]
MSSIRMVENQNDIKVKQIRTDNGTEFRNHKLESFCGEKGIFPNFSSPYTPEQNGVAEKKNRNLIEEHLGKINAKALDGYFVGYYFVSKTFRVFNTRRQQIKETYYVTFDESMEVIRFTNTSEDEIGINDSSRYPPDEFPYEDDPSR